MAPTAQPRQCKLQNTGHTSSFIVCSRLYGRNTKIVRPHVNSSTLCLAFAQNENLIREKAVKMTSHLSHRPENVVGRGGGGISTKRVNKRRSGVRAFDTPRSAPFTQPSVQDELPRPAKRGIRGRRGLVAMDAYAKSHDPANRVVFAGSNASP
jgi:hypothetical protein